MTQCNWDRIEDIYHAASALPASERSAFVEKACAGDGDCISKVNSLLEASAFSGLLDEPVMTLASSDDLLGTTIDGRYEVQRELPHGGMSEVYVALDLRLNRELVVIKILSKVLIQDSYARQHFDQEVEALLRVRKSGVVDVRDRGELADGRPYIVMQYVDGESLRSQIPHEGMDLTRAASILSQIGTALEHVHGKGIFHRDIKPENIMLKRGTDDVVLIDFGIAKVTDSEIALSTVNRASAGTVAYMSPEQLRGERVAASSDIYSMAVVAYEMLTGRRPFTPKSAAQLLDLQRKGVRARPADLRPDLPKRAQQVIFRALSFNPNDRYQNAGEFAADLTKALLANQQNVSGKDGWLSKKQVGLISGALVIVALVVYWAWRPDEPRPDTSKGFNYWIMVQKTHEGKDYQQPYKSNGADIFDNGDKFQLNVLSLHPGYLYIFNEGPPEANRASFRMIYPTQAINEGSASIGANHTVQSDWIPFRGPAGTDNFWIVWAASPLSELESARNQALQHPQAGLTDENLVRVKKYLQTMDVQVSAWAARFQDIQEVKVRKKNDIVLTLAKFAHR